MNMRMTTSALSVGLCVALLAAAVTRVAGATEQTPAPAPAATAPSDVATQQAASTQQAPSEAQAPASSVSPAPAPAARDESFNLKLRGIEERVNELKEKIFQAKARLIQLQEVVLHGAISGAKAVLVHRNEMGSSFVLRRVQYALDGASIFNRTDSGNGELDELEEIEIFNGSIAPGNHQISVYLEYQGYGYGVFSYLKNYVFKVKSSHTFNAEEGKVTTVHIVGHERGGFTAELKDRPAVRFDVEVGKALREASSPQAAQQQAAPGKTGD